MAHAVGILPPARATWADAMRHELDHIDSDREALTWAVGCVVAGYVERSGLVPLLQNVVARGFLTLLIVTQVLSMLFATVMTLAYRLDYRHLAAFMGGFTPGDDYRRFIPLMDATPWWIHALWVGASVLFAASGAQLLRNRASAFVCFAAAWVLGAIGNAISQSMPAYQQVFSYATPMFTRDYVIPAVTALVPMGIAAALWIHGRRGLLA
jgi:hypothetical protein